MPYKKEEKICPECNKDFVSERNKKFCSVSCGTKFTARERRKSQFNDKEQLLCSSCKDYKDKDDFNRCKSCNHRDGREFYCKTCAYNLKRLKSFEKGENLELYARKSIRVIKSRVKHSGLEFNITVEDIVNLYNEQGGRCAISGEIMTTFVSGRGKLPLNMSVDRIDSTKGYILENIHIVTYRVNIMKNDIDLKEFINTCKNIVSHNES